MWEWCHMPCILSMKELQESSLFLLSNDTDIVALGLHYRSLLKGHVMALRNCGSGLVPEILPGTYHFILWQRGWTQRSAKSYCHSITSLVVIHPANLPQKLLVWKQTLLNICTNSERIPANIDFAGVEQYLVNFFKSGTHCESMDHLRYHLHHHSKKTIVDLPPTSCSGRGHILAVTLPWRCRTEPMRVWILPGWWCLTAWHKAGTASWWLSNAMQMYSLCHQALSLQTEWNQILSLL